ncbi:MAG TPA: DUF5658 family protein [Bryobacteraceae bacterium]|nr:DUF5658 family protein [Bryobacteraceae bacterium]
MRSEATVNVQVFLYLQVLDFLTTLVGFKLGISEASPFVRSLLHFGPSIAVAASKIVAIGLAGLCVGLNKSYLVRWINYWYAALIIWNLCNILAV